MEDAGFILGSYGLVAVTMLAFAWRTLRHGRRLAEKVPDSEKYWL